MDGSGASSGEGCLGRHLHCFLLVFAPLLPESAPQFDAGIARFVAVSVGSAAADPATIEFLRPSIHTPVLAAGRDGRSCETTPTLAYESCKRFTP